jgi:DNA-binding response OmpR family regulator
MRNVINIIRQKPFSHDHIKRSKTILQSSQVLLSGLASFLHPEKQNTVLLIENEPSIQFAHNYYLTKMGFTVASAKNGAEALQLFEQSNYILILLDIDLPDMSGIEVCHQMRAHTKNMRIPIIAVTAAEYEITSACLAAGANEVIFKPISFRELQTVLKKHIPLPSS